MYRHEETKYFSEDYRPIDLQKEESTISGSGGGCFPAGTLVRTPRGLRCIDRIKVGEPVIAYDRFGELSEGRVVKLSSHKAGTYKDSLYFVYSKGESLFPKGITGNHAVFDHVSGEHKEISTFKIGDSLTLLDGSLKTISMINRVAEPNVNVHNLIIEPQHTYIVGDSVSTGIRVHNGGGGKDSGSARQAVEAANTLQSSAIAKVLEIYSHGECEGIVGGAKGITFNNTPVQNSTGTYNFQGVTVEERVGTPSQTTIAGFEETEAEIPLANIVITSAGVVEQLPDSNIDAARVTVKLTEGLWQQDKSNGDLLGYFVSYSIAVMDVAVGTWSTVLTKTLKDKTTSPWEISHRIAKPAGAVQWSIKITRTSSEDPAANYKSIISWARLTEILEDPVSYPNIAHVGLTLPASATGNRIPARAYLVKGMKLQVPINYDPLLRTYSGGYWNQQFKTAWTDNPAWVLFDLITNQEYGLQNFLNHTVNVDVISFFEAAMYCDAVHWDGSNYITNLLDDGQLGQEVRYTFNGVMNTQQDAWQLLHAVASNMRAILVNAGDQVSLLQDRPKSSYKIFNNTNVIDGLFVYSGTEATSRATQVNCTFNDKNDRYLPRTISEEDSVAIARYGHSVKSIVAYGCTSESQARRMAKWALYTETHQYDLVSFTVALNIIDVAPGDVVSIMDSEYVSDNNQYLTGRVSSVDGTTVTLGNPVTLLSGYTYTLGIMSLDYEKIDEVLILTGAGTTDVLEVNTTLTAGDYSNHEFFCFSSGNANQEPRKFIIQSITESDRGVYTISGLFYDENKFAAVEQGIVVPDQIYSNLVATVIPAVTNIQFYEYFTNTGIAKENYIDVRWDWESLETQPDGSIIDRSREISFNLKWRRDNGKFTIVNDIPTKSFQIPSTIPGVYDVIIDAQNIQGKKSLSTFGSYDYRIIGANSTLEPPENFYVDGTAGVEFVGTHIPLTWTFPISNENKTDTLLDYILEVYDSAGAALKKTYIIQPEEDKGGKFDYTLQMNTTHFGSAIREVQFKLYSRDMVGERSIANIKNFTNPTPVAPSFSVLSGTSSVFLDIDADTSIDIAGYIVEKRTGTDPFVEAYRGTGNYVSLTGDAGVSYDYRVAAYDTFGDSGVIFSGSQSSTIQNANVDIWIFEGLIFKPNDPSTNSVSWTAGTASVNGGTPIAISAGSAAWTSGILYVYYDGSSGTLSTSTDLLVVVTGVQALATYKGGTSLIVGNGSAFTDGGLILANTVGANQLVADSAIITNTAQIQGLIVDTAHIADGAIVDAKIGNTIESIGYDPVTYTGWNIDKTGNITSYGALSLLDSSGNTILTTGAGAAIEWAKVGGLNRPEDNADATNYLDTRIANALSENSVTTIARPSGGSLSTSGNPATGAIKITLPQSWTSTMMSFEVEVFLFEGNKTFKLLLGGYNYVDLSSWLNTTANLLGSSTSDNRVRFGHDGSNCCIYIGETTSEWFYPKITVKNFQAGFSNFSIAQWESGWGVSIVSSIGTVSADHADALIDAASIKNQGALATSNSADFTTQVTGSGKPDDNATVGATIGTDLSGTFTAGNIGVYMPTAAIGSAQIADLAVTTAKIASLSVDTLQLANNAVTIPIVASIAIVNLAASTYTNVVAATIVVAEGQSVNAQIEAVSSPAGLTSWGSGDVTWNRIRSYRLIYSGTGGVVGQTYQNTQTQVTLIHSQPLGPGTHTFTLQAINILTLNGYANQVYGNSIKILGVKK